MLAFAAFLLLFAERRRPNSRTSLKDFIQVLPRSRRTRPIPINPRTASTKARFPGCSGGWTRSAFSSIPASSNN